MQQHSTAQQPKPSQAHMHPHPHTLRFSHTPSLPTLPSTTQQVLISVDITNFQKRCYRAILERNRSVLLRGSEASGAGPSFNNVSMQLRHCCNHPFLIKGIIEAEGLNGADNETYLSNLVSASGKMLLLDKLLPHLQSEGHRVLLFSQFTMLLDLIEEYIDLKGFAYERLDGSVTGDKRQAAIDRFCSKDSKSFLFLLGTRAGGVGINLTAADTVIIYDPDWNPQNDLQAQARCHRIGQTKLVRIYRLVTKDTYEMHLLDAANQKLGLEHAVIGHGGYHLNTENSSTHGGGDGSMHKGGANKSGVPFKAAEVEELLKHGAQKLFTEEHDRAIEQFNAESIEQILLRCATTKKGEDAKDKSTGGAFSKASFGVDEGGKDGEVTDLHDPDFWSKMLGEEEGHGKHQHSDSHQQHSHHSPHSTLTTHHSHHSPLTTHHSPLAPPSLPPTQVRTMTLARAMARCV